MSFLKGDSMDCNHDLKMLVGTADGIICTGCGKVMTVEEIYGEKPKAEPKKGAKRGKKLDADKSE